MEHDRLINLSDLPNSFEENKIRTAKMRNFAEDVSKAMAFRKSENNKLRPKREKITSLDAIVAKGLDDLESSQLMRLFSAYRDLAAFDKMIDLYKAAPNRDFQNAPMVREQLAVAYRKVSRGGVLSDKMFDYHMSMRLSQDLISDGYGSGVCFENIGRCKRYIANQIKMEDERSQAKQKNDFLKSSVLAFESGFDATLESSVGIQAVHGNIMLGRLYQAHETAKVVYLAALRDGVEESNDYFCISAALQAACVAGEDKQVLNHLYNRLENSISYAWELTDIRRDLDRIVQSMPSPDILEIQQRLQETTERVLPVVVDENGEQKKTELAFLSDVLKGRHMTEDPKLKAVLDNSYSYRGCGSAFRGANRVSGNMSFGGQLPDHAVSRKDLRLFSGLVKMSPAELGVTFDKPVEGIDFDKPLTAIKDPELFMAITDRFIRQTFSTQNFAGSGLHMENNAFEKDEKTGESLYDATVKSVLRATGKMIGDKDAHVDSRTNISAVFALGMGDCRHHAQVKQIMFDMWQKERMNMALRKMYSNVLSGRETGRQDKQDFFDVLDTELRSADVQVMMPIKMKQSEWNGKLCDMTYNPEKTADGKYVVDETGQTHNLEDHTLSWLIKKNRQGDLLSLGLRDAFYQDLHYGWGHMDVDISKIQIDEKGDPLIPAGFIPGEKTSTGKPIEIHQYPTPYNDGKRDSFVKDSIGRDVMLVGVPLDGFATPSDFLEKIKDRKGMFQLMADIRAKDAEIQSKEKRLQSEIGKCGVSVPKGGIKNKQAQSLAVLKAVKTKGKV